MYRKTGDKMIIKHNPTEKEERELITDRRLFLILIIFSLLISSMIYTVSAMQITAYNELNTNTTVHIKTESDLSENYTVLFDNDPLEYTVYTDIIKTGLTPDTNYFILIVGDNGQIQEIQTRTLKDADTPFYLKYGVLGLFIMSLVLLIIGYLIPMIELIALPIELIGFIQAIKTESPFIALLFVIMFAISCLLFGKYGKNIVR